MFAYSRPPSKFGYRLIDEMNRLGILVDLSHTSDQTAEQGLKYSKAPVIWSHSSARAVHNVSRNIPDYILKLVKAGDTDAVVMVSEPRCSRNYVVETQTITCGCRLILHLSSLPQMVRRLSSR